MKPQKVKGKRRTGVNKSNKRSIHTKGKWKAVELDPSVFSEEGLEGLVCFEELTSYKLVDSEKVVARAAKQLKKEKKKAKKRKASEAEEGGGEPSEEGGGEASKKPAKKKRKKKNKKAAAEEETKAEEVCGDAVTQEEAGEDEEKREDEAATEATGTTEATEATGTTEATEPTEPTGTTEATEAGSKVAECDAQSQPKPTKKRKKKKNKQQREQEAIKEEEAEPEPPTDVNIEKEKPSPQVQPAKKQQKNWTNAALSGSEDKVTDMRAWADLFVPSPVLKALSGLGFGSPTPIQVLTLPPAIRDRMDIVGAAETGSGKTLAFGIPMIHTILEWRKSSEGPADAGDEAEPGEEEEEGESLNVPAVDEPSSSGQEADDPPAEQDQGDNEEAEEEEVESLTDENQEEADGDPSEDEDEEDDDDRLGCVKVIENAEFDFDDAAEAEATSARNQPLLGLVLTPTRELAVQVKHHIEAVAKFTDIKTAIVVGGMAQQKQRRMLKRRPEIIIATPGRLWDLIKEKHPHLQNLRQLRCLVIDEADRMVERGHFAELESLLEMLNTVHFNPTRQMFVFSATLTMAHTLPTRVLQKKKRVEQRSRLEVLMAKVGMKSKPKVVDLTRKEATVETLTETRIHCQKDEKDFFLYYFLLQYPGRTMVFANSIDCIKRLNSLLVILDCTPLPLHANMHQKQRLKNLERFAERERCVLLTTDVAARGLDIPDVQHVIHYQVPRASETYVHRSGRTARATKEGLSLLLIGPDDMMNFRKIYKTLGKDEELPMFPIELKCLEAIKERVKLARQIEKIEFHNSKEKHHNSWLRQAAEALDVDVDDDMLLGKGKDEESDRQQQKMVKGMKSHLKRLISQPVFKNMIKTKYPTQMGKLPLAHMAQAGSESALTKLFIQKQTLEKKLLRQQKKQNKSKQQE